MKTTEQSTDDATRTGVVMVGVDGSASSINALVWALDEAQRRGAQVEAIYIYALPSQGDWYVGGHPGVLPADQAAVVKSAREELERAVSRAVPEELSTRLTTVVVADNSAAHGLTRAARHADLLVVGAHHVTGLGRLFGSTTAGVLRHATCPVVVVPDGQRAETAETSDVLVPV